VPSDQGYPYVGVVFFTGIIACESSVVWKILRPRSYLRSWARAGTALLVVIVFGCFWMLGSLHAGHSYLAHLAWLAIMGSLLLFLTIVPVAATMAHNRSSGPA
jgi:hypothetical protein